MGIRVTSHHQFLLSRYPWNRDEAESSSLHSVVTIKDPDRLFSYTHTFNVNTHTPTPIPTHTHIQIHTHPHTPTHKQIHTKHTQHRYAIDEHLKQSPQSLSASLSNIRRTHANAHTDTHAHKHTHKGRALKTHTLTL